MGCGPRSLVFPLPSLKFKFIMTQSVILIPILMKVHFPFLILIAYYPNHIKVWPIQDQSVSISPHFPNYISLFCLRLPSTYRSQFVLAKFQLKKKKKTKKKKTTIDSQLIFRETQFQLCFFCIAMESISAAEKQNMVSLFLEIAVGQSAETARQFLQATSWKLEEAIQLFYIGNEGGLASSSLSSPPIENVPPVPDQNLGKEVDVGNANVGQDVGNEEVRPPLPVKREVLYDDASLYRNQRMGSSAHEANSVVAFRNFDEELKRPGIWESDQNGASTTDSSRDNLASLYRPPFALMHQGPFEKAKTEAAVQDKWLLVNLQSTKEFSSHMLNRDTWANEAVAQTISTNFIFWQVYDDTSEGRKVCTYYNLVSIPVILVIDPITGQKMRSWNGMIQPESLLEDLLPFMDRGPKDHHVVLPHKRPRESAPTIANKIKDEVTKEEDEEISQALAASMEDVNAIRPTPIDDEKTDKKPEVGKEAETYLSEKPNYPTLPEEPKGDRSLLCRVRVRLPDGRTCQRNFLRSDPIQLLWSFCSSQLDEGETRQFRLMQAIPGASNSLDYKSKLTFEESGLSNSVVSVTWK